MELIYDPPDPDMLMPIGQQAYIYHKLAYQNGDLVTLEDVACDASLTIGTAWSRRHAYGGN